MRAGTQTTQGLPLVIAGGSARVNRNRMPALGLAADLDAEQLRVAQRLTAGAAGDAHQRFDRSAARRALGDHGAAAVGARLGERRLRPGHEPAAPAAAEAEADPVTELFAVPA